jgi:hypothetical protein
MISMLEVEAVPLTTYDLQGYRGGILTLPLSGGTAPCIYSLQE